MKLGVIMLGLYIVSGYATDLLLLSAGAKPYLSAIAGVCAMIAFLISGHSLRALETKQGKLWCFLTIWLIAGIPFSHWPGGSYHVLAAYIPKIHLILFFICALAITAEDCAILVLANAAGCFALLFECWRYGTADDSGRFYIPNSISFANPNDLALQLVVSMGLFVFLILNKAWVSRILGSAGLVAGFYYTLKTGSRGSLVACGALAVFCLVFTRYRFRVLLLAIPLTVIAAGMSANTLHRLTLIFLNPAEDLGAATSALDQQSIESQLERQELLKASLVYMVTHPLFGVGAGEFADVRWSDMKQMGTHVASLGTHNSYTEIGSECGFPALICFAGVLIVSIRSNYRIYKRAAPDPALHRMAQLSLCLLLGCLGFAVNAFFHHSSYSAYVSTLGGLSAALYLAADPVLKEPGRAAALRV